MGDESLKIRGYRMDGAGADSALRLGEVRASVKAHFRAGAFRSGTERLDEVSVGPDDLVELSSRTTSASG